LGRLKLWVNPKSGETATAGSKEPGEQDAERKAKGWLLGAAATNHALLSLAVRDNYVLKPKQTAKGKPRGPYRKPKQTAKKPRKIAKTKPVQQQQVAAEATSAAPSHLH
jgi:hypothetical protein